MNSTRSEPCASAEYLNQDARPHQHIQTFVDHAELKMDEDFSKTEN